MEHQNRAHKLGSTICSGFLASRQEETWGKMIFQILPQSTTHKPARMLQWKSIQTKLYVWEIFWLLLGILFHLTSVGNTSIS